jgi:hypothetical protein
MKYIIKFLLISAVVLSCFAAALVAYSQVPPLPAPATNRLALRRITLAWDPSPDTNVTGYRLYYGPTSGTYTNSVTTVSNQVTVVLTNTRSAFFAATATNAAGMESDYSNEVQWTVATNAPRTNVVVAIQRSGSAAGPWQTITQFTNDITSPANNGAMFWRLQIR